VHSLSIFSSLKECAKLLKLPLHKNKKIIKLILINELGWSNPHQIQAPQISDYQIKAIATLGGVVMFEISGDIFLNVQIRADIHKFQIFITKTY